MDINSAYIPLYVYVGLVLLSLFSTALSNAHASNKRWQMMLTITLALIWGSVIYYFSSKGESFEAWMAVVLPYVILIVLVLFILVSPPPKDLLT
jgi:hypothetical protein